MLQGRGSINKVSSLAAYRVFEGISSGHGQLQDRVIGYAAGESQCLRGHSWQDDVVSLKSFGRVDSDERHI